MAGADERVLDDSVITAIAAAHSKTAAQVVLRWTVQRGTVAIPKTQTISHLEENHAIYDFALSEDEMQRIERHRPPPPLQRSRRFWRKGIQHVHSDLRLTSNVNISVRLIRACCILYLVAFIGRRALLEGGYCARLHDNGSTGAHRTAAEAGRLESCNGFVNCLSYFRRGVEFSIASVRIGSRPRLMSAN